MRVGFTGTQDGMTQEQRTTVRDILDRLESDPPGEFHHGDCVGADAEAAHMAIRWVVHSHPPIDPRKRAFTAAHVTHPKRDYLDRNHDIVDATDLLIAAPKTAHEQMRSGTWATVRYARKVGRTILIVNPSGES